MKFKEWDRVIVNVPGILKGNGTVLGGIDPRMLGNAYPVRMDEKDISFLSNSCSGLCDDGYGLYICKIDMTLITNREDDQDV